jgi:hypothetical protein
VSILNAPSLRVSHILQVSVLMTLSKDLSVEMPVIITHPSSWSDVPPFAIPDATEDAATMQREMDAMFGNRVPKETPIELPGRGRPRRWSKSDAPLADIPDEDESQESPMISPPTRHISQVNVHVQTPSAFVIPNQMLAAVTRDLETPQDNGTVKQDVGNLGMVKNLRVANPDPDGDTTIRKKGTEARRSVFGSKRVREFFGVHKDLPNPPEEEEEEVVPREAGDTDSKETIVKDSGSETDLQTEPSPSIRESIVTIESEDDEGLVEYSKFVFPDAVSSMLNPPPEEPQREERGLRRRVTVMLKRLGSKKTERRGSL